MSETQDSTNPSKAEQRDVILPVQVTPDSAAYHWTVANRERALLGIPPQPRIPSCGEAQR